MIQIDLPRDVIDRANRLAASNEDVAAVLARGVDLIEWQAGEVAAVMKGVAAYERGEHQSLEDFDHEIREEFGCKPHT